MYFLFFLLSLLQVGEAILLPKPSGPFSVALSINPMTDYHRLDPYAPNHHQKRQVLASIFWPVDAGSCSTERVPYMPPATAAAYGQAAGELGIANDTVKALEMEVCRVSTRSACKGHSDSKTKFPVVVFSPGSGNSRLLYSAMAMSLTSYGNVVILLDHPYDAEIVEFPDGAIIPGADIPDETEYVEQATQVRAEDISFVVSQIHRPSFQHNVFKALPGKVDCKRIAVLGHSMGGASAAAAMLLDPRIRGGVNLDGQLFEPVLSQGLDRPFMQLGAPNHRSEDATWVKFWKKLRGPKVELDVAGTVHGSFTDVPLVLSVLGLPEEVLEQTAPLFGSVEGEKLQEIISRTLQAFTCYMFEGTKRPLLEAVREFEELSIVKSRLSAQ